MFEEEKFWIFKVAKELQEMETYQGLTYKALQTEAHYIK